MKLNEVINALSVQNIDRIVDNTAAGALKDWTFTTGADGGWTITTVV